MNTSAYFALQEGDTALTWASYIGHLEVVKVLLTAGADKEAKDKVGGKDKEAKDKVRGIDGGGSR